MPLSSYIMFGSAAIVLTEQIQKIQADAVRMFGELDGMPSMETLQSMDASPFDEIEKDFETLTEAASDVRARHDAEAVPSAYVHADDNECSICLEGPPDNPLDWYGVCNHAFHKGCIETFFHCCGVTARCPHCRVAIVAEDFLGVDVRNEATDNCWNGNDFVIDELAQKLRESKTWFRSLKNAFEEIVTCVEDGIDDLSKVQAFLHLAEAEPLDQFILECRFFRTQMVLYRGLRAGMSFEAANEWAQQIEFNLEVTNQGNLEVANQGNLEA